MKKISGPHNPFEVSKNSVLKLFTSEDYCPYVLPFMLPLSVHYRKFCFKNAHLEVSLIFKLFHS